MSGLRERIAEVMRRAEGEWWREEDPQTDVDSHVAQAIIDKFDFTSNGEHGYVEIWGCYDTRFED